MAGKTERSELGLADRIDAEAYSLKWFYHVRSDGESRQNDEATATQLLQDWKQASWFSRALANRGVEIIGRVAAMHFQDKRPTREVTNDLAGRLRALAKMVRAARPGEPVERKPRFKTPPCPECGKNAKVDHTEGRTRHCKCKECGHSWKVARKVSL